jgi:2-phospho-L-lactate/phosphoenolpyruvate guanylyltransferase
VAAPLSWTVLLAIKSLPRAKSRLRVGVTDDISHASLVEAMRADTIAAVQGAARVTHVVTIADHPGEDWTLVQSAPGLNAALSEAGAFARLQWPDTGLVALVADLPALGPDELDAALESAGQYAQAFVSDEAATGTTMLTAAPGVELEPRFGAGSAARHGERAVRIDGGAGLRHDVDTWADLQVCAALGLGPRTAAAYRNFMSGRHDEHHERLIPGH